MEGNNPPDSSKSKSFFGCEVTQQDADSSIAHQVPTTLESDQGQDMSLVMETWETIETDVKVMQKKTSSFSDTYNENVITAGDLTDCINPTKVPSQVGTLTDYIDEHLGNKPYQCAVCQKTFRFKSMVTTHILRSHTNEPLASHMKIQHRKTQSVKKPPQCHQCDVCQQSFRFKSVLTAHMRYHANERPYQCLICVKKYMHKESLERHNRIHNKERPFKCSVCQKLFRQNVHFVFHMSTHSGETFSDKKSHQCVVCQKTFVFKCLLTNHMRSHSNEHQYQCLICLKGFKLKVSLKFHNRIHKNEKSYECSICQKPFRQNARLASHMKTQHGETESIKKLPQCHQCNVCQKSFICKSLLTKHIRTHSNEHLYQCSICLKMFKHKVSIKLHNRIHNNEKPYKCSICQKSFRQNALFVSHMSMHSGETFSDTKSYQCAVCQKTFGMKFLLTKHMRSHTNKRLFQCFICFKKFMKKVSLINHIRVHHIDNPYKCSLCSVIYKCQNSLNAHMVKHKRKQKPVSLKTEKKTHLCFVCGKKIRGCISRHMLVHKNEKPHKCLTCQKSFTVKGTLTSHMRIHTGEKAYLCSVCGKGLAGRNSWKKHMNAHSKNTISLKCSICFKIFGSQNAVNSHMECHKGGGDENTRLECSICQKIFKNQHAVNSHMKKHKNETEREDGCDKALYGKDALNQTKTDSSYDKSDNVSIRERNVMNTQAIVRAANSKYQCTFCPKEFKEPSKLIEHLRVHTKEKPFKCSMCEKRFGYTSALRRHMIGRHDAENMLHKCFICNEGFSRNGLMREHIKERHGGQKPLKCNICLRLFSHIGRLNNHMLKIHKLKEELPQPVSSLNKITAKKIGIVCDEEEAMKNEIPYKKEEPVRSEMTCSTVIPRTSLILNDLKEEMVNIEKKGEISKGGIEITYNVVKYNVISCEKASEITRNVEKNGEIIDCVEISGLGLQNVEEQIQTSHVFHVYVRESTTSYDQTKQPTDGVKEATSYQCSLCDGVFSYDEDLITHMKSHDTPSPRSLYQCSFCEKLVTGLRKLKMHMISHTKEKLHKCCFCLQPFLKKSYLKKHICKVHKDIKGVEYLVSESIFSEITHHEISTSENILGEIVNKLKEHPLQKAQVSYVIVEEISYDAIQKMQNIIILERDHCYLCGTLFGSKEELTTHMKTHYKKLSGNCFQCSFCQKSFPTKGNLSEHMRVHTKEQRYQCHFCTKAYNTKREMRRHMVRIHKGEKRLSSVLQETVLDDNLKIPTKEKPFQCPICQRVFAFKNCMKKHLRTIHFKERRYKCPVCQNTFAQQGTLKNHVDAVHKEVEIDKSLLSLGRRQRKNTYNVILHSKLNQNNLCEETPNLMSNVKGTQIQTGQSSNNDMDSVDLWEACGDDNSRDGGLDTDLVITRCPTRHLHNHNTKPNLATERLHRCSVCCQAFIKRNALQEHMVTHSEQHLLSQFSSHENILYGNSHSVVMDNQTMHQIEKDHQLPSPTVKEYDNDAGSLADLKNDMAIEVETNLSGNNNSLIVKNHMIHQVQKDPNVPSLNLTKYHNHAYRVAELKNNIAVDVAETNLGENMENQTIYQLQADHLPSLNVGEYDNDNDTKAVAEEINDIAIEVGETNTYLFEDSNFILMEKNQFDNDPCITSLNVRECLIDNNNGTVGDLKDAIAANVRKIKPYTCAVCGKDFSQSKYIRPHMRKHTGEKPYKCSICDKAFSHGSNLKKHIRTHEKPVKIVDKPHQCSVCHKRFIHKGSLKEHMLTHLGKKHKCPKCREEFSYVSSLYKHMRLHGKNCHECTLCQNTFNARVLLNKHMKTHRGEYPFQCSICQKAYKQNVSLKIHMQRHSGEKPFKCSKCEIGFFMKRSLDKHVLNHDPIKKHEINADKKQIQCSICLKIVRTKTHLAEHMRVHTKEKPFECSVCQRKFSHGCSLNRHITSHSRDARYKCTICEKGFRSANRLKGHVRIHSEDTRYKCSICETGFNHFSSFDNHMKTHEPNDCSNCNTSFTKRTELKMHIASVHNGQKLIKCILCKKDFLHQKSLKLHVRRCHAGEKHHKCSICQKEFFHADTVKNHMNKYHTEVNPKLQSDSDNKHSEQQKSHQEVSCANELCPEKNQNMLPESKEEHSDEKQQDNDQHPNINNDSVDVEYEDLDKLFEPKSYQSDFRECPICYKKYSRKHFNRHLETHSQRSDRKGFECTICFKILMSKTSVKEHILIHRGEKPFKCSVCQKHFRLFATLRKHKVTHKKHKLLVQCSTNKSAINETGRDTEDQFTHTPDVQYVEGSNYAIEKVSQNDNSEHHVTTLDKERHSRKLKTTLCENDNSEKIVLNQSDNLKEKTFKCEICPKAFKLKISLKFHMTKKHCAAESKNGTTGAADLYCMCTVCGKTIKRKGFSTHMKIHSEIYKRHLCAVCGKNFKTASYLSVHMICHDTSRRKRFQCQTCGKGFMENYMLVQHERIHSGVKPFQCGLCPKAFRLKIYLRLHLSEQHNDATELD